MDSLPQFLFFFFLIFRKGKLMKLVGDEKQKNYKKKVRAQGFLGNLETCTGMRLCLCV